MSGTIRRRAAGYIVFMRHEGETLGGKTKVFLQISKDDEVVFSDYGELGLMVPFNSRRAVTEMVGLAAHGKDSGWARALSSFYEVED